MNIVIQPFHDYRKWLIEGFRTRDAHVFEHLNLDDRVDNIVVINRPISLAERLLLRKKVNNIGDIIYSDGELIITQISRKIFVIDIIVNDFISVITQRKKWWDYIFKKEKVIRSIQNALNFLEVHNNFTLLVQNPMAVSLSSSLKPNLFVFDTIDNWLKHQQMKDLKNILEQNYATVDRSADLIFSVSEKNKELFPNNKNFIPMPNGVDVNIFAEKLKNYQLKKRISFGYVGKIQDRFDFSLISKIAAEFPDVDILIYGPLISGQRESSIQVRKYPNIKYLGNVSYETLPEVMQSFEIALIPHKVNEFTDSMNPLKVYEYIAAGKMVISTKVNGVLISNGVLIANDESEFISLLKYAKNQYEQGLVDPNQISNSIDVTHTWQSIVHNIVSIIARKESDPVE